MLMLDRADLDELSDIVAVATTYGPANRNQLLVAAVSARAAANVIDILLRLPEGCYRDVAQVRAAMLVSPIGRAG
jgi:hypothetical protein